MTIKKNTMTPSEYVTHGLLINTRDPFSEACKLFNIKKSDLFTKKRNRDIVMTRQLLMYYFFHANKTNTFEKVGRIFNKHHATVIHSIKMVNNLKEIDKEYKIKFDMFNKAMNK